MPLFRRSAEPEKPKPPILTINGRPQSKPEAPGAMQRRFRLFTECSRRLAEHPLAQEDAIGTPLGDGLGLEGLVAQIVPLFERERSLIRWVALRGALSEIFIRVLDPTSAARSSEQLEQVMGLEWETSRGGEPHPDIVQSWRPKLSDEQRNAALGLASFVLVRAANYGRLEGMSANAVIGDSNFWMSEAAALDCIAWSAIAMLRLEVAQQLFPRVPEPDALPSPGWYTEPLFGKAERYWDGSDWTNRCRVQNGRQYTEVRTPLT